MKSKNYYSNYITLSHREAVLFVKNQRTIRNKVNCFGIGLHNGAFVNMTLLPAPIDNGISFRRVAVCGKILGEVKAEYDLVSTTFLGTNLVSRDGKMKIATIEHLMAALWGCGIDNVIVEVDTDELPIMDGSSDHFVFMIESAGIKEQNASRRFIEVLRKVEISDGDASAFIAPANDFSVKMEISFDDNVISKQSCDFYANTSSFKVELAKARTFGFLKDVEKLKTLGLIKGGSLDNAIVIGEDKVLNNNGLRFQDEFVRHKVLDSIGDLYLSGARIMGHFNGVKSGHSLNNQLLRTLFADKSAWRMVQFNDKFDFAA
jgi:UDP-3-O-[3-hydroxymyristoyl] N-acetylglucosamine deacetylase